MPDTTMPDVAMPDITMPNATMPDKSKSEYINDINDCAAGCPLAMAYVPWQSWEKTYDDEVAFRVGTVFPSLDLPFLGGNRK
jgi:hypothetical protein